jgi:hypothetical protein
MHIYLLHAFKLFTHAQKPHCLLLQGWSKCCVPMYSGNTWTRPPGLWKCASEVFLRHVSAVSYHRGVYITGELLGLTLAVALPPATHTQWATSRHEARKPPRHAIIASPNAAVCDRGGSFSRHADFAIRSLMLVPYLVVHDVRVDGQAETLCSSLFAVVADCDMSAHEVAVSWPSRAFKGS